MSLKWSTPCLRAGALRLLLSLILGSLAISGYLVAPILFIHAESSTQAGQIAGVIFQAANRGALLMLLAVTIFLFQSGERRLMIWIPLCLLAALIGINEFAITPIIHEIKSSVTAVSALAAEHPQRQAFAQWHGVSAVLHLSATLLSAWLVICGPSAKSCTHSSSKP